MSLELSLSKLAQEGQERTIESYDDDKARIEFFNSEAEKQIEEWAEEFLGERTKADGPFFLWIEDNISYGLQADYILGSIPGVFLKPGSAAITSSLEVPNINHESISKFFYAGHPLIIQGLIKALGKRGISIVLLYDVNFKDGLFSLLRQVDPDMFNEFEPVRFLKKLIKIANSYDIEIKPIIFSKTADKPIEMFKRIPEVTEVIEKGALRYAFSNPRLLDILKNFYELTKAKMKGIIES